MYFQDQTVYLPERRFPYILDGKEQPKNLSRIFSTPDGLFPRMVDIATLFGENERILFYRRSANSRPKFKEFRVIHSPTLAEVEEAIENVNNLYTEMYSQVDNCPFGMCLDENLFKEQCWLVTTDYVVGVTLKAREDIRFTYAYNGVDYDCTYKQWLRGSRPHKENI